MKTKPHDKHLCEIIAALCRELSDEKRENEQFATAFHLALSHLSLEEIEAIEASLDAIYGCPVGVE